jgi:hypothetical protein
MSLDGLRAWIGEVERKLGMRTRVFLVLTTIAIGGAGAGIYLAVEARNDSVSQSDVRALQERLEGRIDEGGATAGGSSVARLEAELKALQAEVDSLQGGKGASKGTAGGGAAAGGGGGSTGSGPTGSTGSGGNTGAGGSSGSATLQELLREAKAKAAK